MNRARATKNLSPGGARRSTRLSSSPAGIVNYSGMCVPHNRRRRSNSRERSRSRSPISHTSNGPSHPVQRQQTPEMKYSGGIGVVPGRGGGGGGRGPTTPRSGLITRFYHPDRVRSSRSQSQYQPSPSPSFPDDDQPDDTATMTPNSTPQHDDGRDETSDDDEVEVVFVKRRDGEPPTPTQTPTPTRGRKRGAHSAGETTPVGSGGSGRGVKSRAPTSQLTTFQLPQHREQGDEEEMEQSADSGAAAEQSPSGSGGLAPRRDSDQDTELLSSRGSSSGSPSVGNSAASTSSAAMEGGNRGRLDGCGWSVDGNLTLIHFRRQQRTGWRSPLGSQSNSHHSLLPYSDEDGAEWP